MAPTVSVCIPTYDGERFVEQTVRSALAQTYDDLEVTVVDDGSTDSTLAVLAAIDDPRLRVLADGAHVGPVENFNRALATARGRYVKLLCQDDVLSPECIAHQVAAFEREPGRVVVVSGRRDIVDEQGRVLWRGRGWRGADGVIDGAAALRACVRAGRNLIGEPSAVLCDRNVVEALQGFDRGARYLVDLDLWFRMLDVGALAYLPETVATFRVSTTSWSAALSRQQAGEGRELFRAARARTPGVVRRQDVLLGSARVSVAAWGRRGVFLVNRARRFRGRLRPR